MRKELGSTLTLIAVPERAGYKGPVCSGALQYFQRRKELPLRAHQILRVPLHAGYREQPQKYPPAFLPRRASRLIIELPHLEHVGEPELVVEDPDPGAGC